MATTDPIVILSYARTPMGSFQGALAPVSATELGATAVKAALERAGIKGDQVDKVFMGNVLSAGLGQAPARQAALGAGLPPSAEAVTINKVCGSGMQAAIFATDMLKSGSADVIVAGGMESMSNAPYLSKKYRGGARIGHDTVYDHMMLDGLEDAYEPGRAMGTFAEEAAQEYQFTREEMDAYAIESLRRANDAIKSGRFEKEIAEGVDIRPTLLRVLTDLYVQANAHTGDEERQFVELTSRLIHEVDDATRAELRQLAEYSLRHLGVPGNASFVADEMRRQLPRTVRCVGAHHYFPMDGSACDCGEVLC